MHASISRINDALGADFDVDFGHIQLHGDNQCFIFTYTIAFYNGYIHLPHITNFALLGIPYSNAMLELFLENREVPYHCNARELN